TCCVQDIDDTAALSIGLQEVLQGYRWFAEQLLATLTVEVEQRALDGANARGGQVAIARPNFGALLVDMREHGWQNIQIQQQPTVIVGHPKQDLQYAALGLVQIQ